MKPKIEVVKGDIFRQEVDAIVNPANSHMAHAGGLAGVIAHRAGRELDTASRALAPVPTGSAIITTPGKLPFQAVIHTVGPIFEKYPSAQADALLSSAHRAALRRAGEAGLQSIAFPAVSCGIFGYPVDRAAPVAIKAVRNALRHGVGATIWRVVFVLPADAEYKAFRRALYGWWRFWKR